MDRKRHGTLIYDKESGRYDIRFSLEHYYGGLHCGECFDVLIGSRWVPTRIEMSDRWYLVGVKTDHLAGLRVRMYGRSKMRYEDFTAYLNSIRPGSDATAARWLEWAKELEGMDSSGYELPKGTYKTAENFLQEFSGQLKKIQERYGDEIAGQIISLADIPACPFPWEMRLAAEHLANGGNLFDIEQMEREGTLEDGQYPNDIPENDHDVNNEDIQLQM